MSGARPGASDASVALQSAVVSYSCGLQLDPLSAVLYSNRCAAQLQLAALATSNQATVSHASILSNDDRDHLLKRALLDATASAMLRPEWSKAHSRLGETQFRLGNLQAAVDAYTRAYECELAELQQASPSTVESMKNRGMGHSSILRSLNEAMAALEAEKKQREQEDLRSESSKRQRKQGAATAGDGGAAKGSSCIVS
jgi:tetratricopeptide (TPR) repeat protein